MSDQNDHPIEDVLDDIEGASGDGELSLGEVLDSFESRSLGAVLLIMGILILLPVPGAIPGMPDLATLVVLAAVGHSFVGGERRFWAPEKLRNRTVDGARVTRLLDRIRPYGRIVDGWVVSARLVWLVDSLVARTAVALTAALVALLMAVLSFVPFAAMAPAAAWVLFGLALMGRDGLFALAGYLFVGLSAVLLSNLWSAIF